MTMTHETQLPRLTAPHAGRGGAFVAVLVALFLFAAAFFTQSAFAGFGFEPGSVDVTVLDGSGSFEAQAGAHPFSMSTEFALNTIPNPVAELGGVVGLPVSDEADVRNVVVHAPAGVLGNPTATPRCKIEEFMGPENLISACPDNTQIGVVYNTFNLFGKHVTAASAIYNLQPGLGQPALFGFKAAVTPVFAVPSIRSNGDYGIDVTVTNIDQTVDVTGSKFVLWGVPASAAHDSERGEPIFNRCGGFPIHLPPCKSTAPLKALLTNPTDCEHGAFAFGMETQSWQGTTGLPGGRTDSTTVLTHDSLGTPAGMTGCERVPFEPSIDAKLQTELASTATGLNFGIEIPGTGLENPTGIAQSLMKKAVVTLPEGVTINPSAGEGMGVCTPAEYAAEQLDTRPGEECPNSAELGTVQIKSPLLDAGELVEGALYLAQPDNVLTGQAGAENPFDTLLAMYMVARIPARGVIIKAAGRVDLDPVTGRLTTTFDDLPQQAFSSFKLHFREGARAPLVSTPTCGPARTVASLTPYSAPDNPVVVSSDSPIVAGVNDGPCASGGVPPFGPQVLSGMQNNRSGSFSPFYLRISRGDGEQEITNFSTVLPPGLTGSLTGIPFCPDTAIEAARLKTGQQELSSPSCPVASEIGHTQVGAGVGGVLAWTPGKVYLAGPYHGSALSLVSVTSATVGPFDLGTVVIRFALRINPNTAQAEIDSTGSDPIPHIIQGVVTHVREIRVYIDRPNFMLNPTSCDPLSISNTITGVGASIASAADDLAAQTATRFQAADCAALKFKPTFTTTTSGKTSRANGASLHVKLTYPKTPQGSQANIRRVRVELPKALPSRLTTLNKACPDTVFEQNPAACPPQSRVGFAKATTPVLPVPLEGPAYFVSHGGAKFPELTVVLQGYGITVDLKGETFISKAGVTSSTFNTVPDVPVGAFELTLPQGPYSALAANGNLCTTKLTMPTTFTAQNGTTTKQNTHIKTTNCPKKKPKHKTKKATKTNKHTGHH